MKNNLLITHIVLWFMMVGMSYAQSTVLMNEFYSRGDAVNPDWIEVHNVTSADIDISGYKIYDSGGQAGTKPKKEFPPNSILPANGFIVIITDNTGADSDFGLGSGGDEVWLENASGTLIDHVVIPAMDVTQSFGRYPDGGTNLKLLAPLTRGTSNVLVKMNEVYSRGTTTDPDWIELHNASASDIDITGYKIYDNGGKSGSKPKMELPSGSTIPANGFFVIITADGSAADFGLSSGGETVWLEDNTGLLIDSVAFAAMTETQSYGRFPDGSPSWQLLDVITKGNPNLITSVDEDINIFASYNLFQNYPNPFNPTTTISYQIGKQSLVTLVVYNILGKEVATLVNEVKSPGTYNLKFDGTNLSSGIYFYKLSADNFNSVKKFTLMK